MNPWCNEQVTCTAADIDCNRDAAAAGPDVNREFADLVDAVQQVCEVSLAMVLKRLRLRLRRTSTRC